MTLGVGQRLSHYEILAPLGAGAMGEVFRARDPRLGRDVAIKVVPRDLAADPQALARFQREGRAVAAISHPNIVAIFDVGTSEGIAYAVTELLQGETLRELLRKGPLARGEALSLAAQIADGLAAAHAQGIVHRDLKPENVFLTSDGRIKIIDFGLARTWDASGVGLDETGLEMTAAGALVGTPIYMSPEQVRGEAVTDGSDLFALGGLLYEMLSGTAPFKRKNLADTLVAILQEPAPPLDIDRECQLILQRALAKRCEDRFSSADELARTLRAAMNGASARPPAQRSRWRTVVLALTLGGLLGAGYLYLRGGLSGPGASGGVPSLAVLPFSYAADDAAVDYASTAITLTLTTSLAQIRSLEVRPYSAVARYEGGGPIEPSAVGRELGVERVLVGTVAALGDNLLVSLELVDVERNSLLWGTTVQRSSDELIDLRTELAQALSEQLRLELTQEESRELVRRPTEDRKALELYVLGLREWARYDEPGVRASVKLFEQALERDPQFALAWSGLASAYAVLAMGYDHPERTLPRVKEYADKALALEPDLPEALTSLGTYLLLYERDAAAAMRAFDAALERSPNFAQGYHYLAHAYEVTGRPDQALEAILAGHQLDPTSPLLTSEVGWVHYNARHYEEAVEWWERAIEDHPEFIMAYTDSIGAYVQLGRMDEALDAAEKAVSLAPEDGMVALRKAYALASAGRSEEARALLGQVQLRKGEAFVNPSQEAGVYAALGDPDRAFPLLEEAIEVHDVYGAFIGVDPQLDPLRSDPRFDEILRRLGFEE